MREKLIEMHLPQVGRRMPNEVCRCDYCMKVASEETDQILTLIREEIKKVENPYPATRKCADEDGAIRTYHDIPHRKAEEFRQAILKALEP